MFVIGSYSFLIGEKGHNTNLPASASPCSLSLPPGELRVHGRPPLQGAGIAGLLAGGSLRDGAELAGYIYCLMRHDQIGLNPLLPE